MATGPPLATPTGCHSTVQSLDSRASQRVTGRQSEVTRRILGKGTCLQLSRPTPWTCATVDTARPELRQKEKPDLWVLSQEPRGPPLMLSDTRGNWV